MREVASKTFTAPIVREYSSVPGVTPLGTHESTMTLYIGDDDPLYTCIEWDIPGADEFLSIGIWMERLANGGLALSDYDGTFSLPAQAVDLLRSHGITVDPEFDPRTPERTAP